MYKDEKLFCNWCGSLILITEQYTTFRKFNTDKEAPPAYKHFHNRKRTGDCWDQFLSIGGGQ